MSAPKVSVVIATYMRADRLPELISALEAQTLPREDFDVIFADDASPDGTAGVLADLAAHARVNVRVVRSDRNRGPGHARNNGWRLSDAPVIAFTDDDCLPAPGWLEAGLERLSSEPVGIVQGRTIPDPRIEPQPWAKSVEIEDFSDRYETCNIFYRTDVLRDVDGFDEDMPFFGEDTVLGWTARRRGVRSAFEPAALVHHAVTHPGARYFGRWAMQHGNWATLVRRFPEMREGLWLHVFTKKRHAALLGAVAGIAAGVAWPPAFALAAPYLWRQRPRGLNKTELVDHFLLGSAFDVAVVAGMLKGSVRERTLVL